MARMTDTKIDEPYRILVTVGEPGHLAALLAVAAPLARARQGHVLPVYVGATETRPPWFEVPDEYADVVDEPTVITGEKIGTAVLAYAREIEPDLLLVHWRGQLARGRYLLGRTLDPLIQYAPCDVAVVRINEEPESFVARIRNLRKILVPMGGGPNAGLAMQIGLDLAPETDVTAIRVASPNMGPTAISAQWSILRGAMETFEDEENRITPQVVLSANVVDGIIREAMRDYDLVLIGASGESFIDRLIFGNLPQELAFRLHMPLMIVRSSGPIATAALRRARWRLINLMTQLAPEERISIYRLVRRAARADRDYYAMMTLAAGIGALGLLLNSAAVIIGAMVVAPMMSALVGIGMGIVQGDFPLLRLSLRTMVLGTTVVIAVSALIGLLTPSRALTPEMAARTSPTLLDLGVALISGAAAGYATAREDVANALPGVAIAVALVPPLATFGLTAVFGLVPEALGSFLLFLTNLVGIVSMVALLFLWMGFRPNIAERTRARTFRGGVAGTIALIATVSLILGILSADAVRRASLEQKVGQVLHENVELLGQEAEISSWSVEIGPVMEIDLSVETTEDVTPTQVLNLQLALLRRLDRPVSVNVTVIPVRRLAPRLPAESRAPGLYWSAETKTRPQVMSLGTA